MLFLLLILSGLGRLTSADHYSEASHLQLTVPRKLRTNTNNGDLSETHVIYTIQINRKTYTLHLEKQSFLDPHFLVYAYNKSGALYPDSSFRKGHCFYQGYAVEIPKSAVTLSTCSGLRGLLQLENISYGIEPLESAAKYEHVLYQIKNNKVDFLPSQDNYPMIQLGDQAYRILVKSEKKSDVALLKRTLKIQVIMDKALYDYMGSEVAVATEKVVHIFGLINTMFSQLKVTAMLTSLELWSDQNKILSTGDPNEVLQRFVLWKEKVLFQRSHEVTFLLIYRDYTTYVGATYRGMACDSKLAVGIALYPKTITLEAFSVVMAQLLGINLGLTYGDIYNCYCPETTCIMNPQAIRSRGVKVFSSCSVNEFKRAVSQPEFECLQNQNISKVVVQGRESSCGDGIVEGGEQCDCGSAEECLFKKCCNMATCELRHSAECGSGPCCNSKNCRKDQKKKSTMSFVSNSQVQSRNLSNLVKRLRPRTAALVAAPTFSFPLFLRLKLLGTMREFNTFLKLFPRGHICRISRDPCDFTEYCTGSSEFCVDDMKSLDFELCNNKTAFCYKGICRDPTKQCVELFGKFSKGSSYLCAEEVNFLGDDFGNCFPNRCVITDTFCAKIVCHWTHTKIASTASYDIQYTYLGGQICMSASKRSNTSGPDESFVVDGTICDQDRVCMSRKCVQISTLISARPCNSTLLCGGHGVCNTNNHCHCDAGFTPPSCELIPSSPGGSIDDGFWLLSEGKIVSLPIKEPRTAAQKNGLFISFCIFLTGLMLIAIIALKWNKMKFWKREETVSEGSMSESSKTNSNESYTESKISD